MVTEKELKDLRLRLRLEKDRALREKEQRELKSSIKEIRGKKREALFARIRSGSAIAGKSIVKGSKFLAKRADIIASNLEQLDKQRSMSLKKTIKKTRIKKKSKVVRRIKRRKSSKKRKRR